MDHIPPGDLSELETAVLYQDEQFRSSIIAITTTDEENKI